MYHTEFTSPTFIHIHEKAGNRSKNIKFLICCATSMLLFGQRVFWLHVCELLTLGQSPVKFGNHGS